MCGGPPTGKKSVVTPLLGYEFTRSYWGKPPLEPPLNDPISIWMGRRLFLLHITLELPILYATLEALLPP